ncbi:MAG: Cys-tRNA(Pro) deacylase [Bacteroidetes bacterium]|nr:Cys-tRNA(Pro) deacylase [Bacteroidota bacterium]
MKTNATRILESRNIPHEQLTYDSSDGAIDAIAVANKIGAEHEQVFKTLVARGDKTGLCVFCIPGPFELDLKKAATASGNKKVELIAVKELLPLTGYIRGGCSPIGMKKQYPTWIDETAQLHERIYVSAGAHGAQILINPVYLAEVVEAAFVDLT